MPKLWNHPPTQHTPCNMCFPFIGEVFADDNLIPLPAHPNCDCYYTETGELPTITEINWSNISPAVLNQWLRYVEWLTENNQPIPPIMSPLIDQLTANQPNFTLALGKVNQQGNMPETTTRLSLALTPTSKKGNAYEIILIDPGRGNGFTFPAEVLQADAHLFNNCTSFIDHELQSRANDRPGGRSIRDICGAFSNIRAINGTVYGDLYPRAPAGDLLTAVLDDHLHAQANNEPTALVGFSADIEFQHTTDGRVTKLLKAHSCDLVFDPARGGKIVRQLFSNIYKETPMPDNQPPTTPTQDTPQAVEQPTPAQIQALHTEAQQMLRQAFQVHLTTTLNNSNLPPVARDRVRTNFTNRAGHQTDIQDLQNAITTEQSYLASIIQQAGVVTGLGSDTTPSTPQNKSTQIQLGRNLLNIPAGSDPLDRLRMGVTRWFGGQLPAGVNPSDIPKIAFDEAYVALTGDYGFRGVFDENQVTRLGFANITDTTIAQIVADSMNVIISQEWEMLRQATDYFWWEKVVKEENLESFFDVDWTTSGGFANLSSVTPGTDVSEITVTNLDNSETGTWSYPAGLISIPLHTFDKANTRGWIKNLPDKLAKTAIRTLSAAISNIFTQASGTGPTLSDGIVLFHTSHANLRTTAGDALSFASWQTAIQDHYDQTEQESGEKLGINPWGVLVPSALRSTAIQILANDAEHGTADRNINPFQYAAERVVVVPHWTDTNNWGSFLDPRIAPGIGVGYRYGKLPQIVPEPGGMNSQGMFINRSMRWKVEHFYNIGVINYRALQKRNIA